MEGINLKLRLLKSKRVLKGIYQHEIAKEIGISHKSYNFKENGKVGFRNIKSKKGTVYSAYFRYEKDDESGYFKWKTEFIN